MSLSVVFTLSRPRMVLMAKSSGARGRRLEYHQAVACGQRRRDDLLERWHRAVLNVGG